MKRTGYLRSERLRLRAFEPSDATQLYNWEQGGDTWDSSTVRNPLSLAFFDSYLVDSANSIVTKGELSLMIEALPQGEAVGYLQFLDYDSISRRVGLGLYICPEARRQGYAYEVMLLAQDYAFQHLGVRMMYADILASNTACCQLFERLGYELTATLKSWHFSQGEYHDLRYYQLWNNQLSNA